MDWVPGWDCHGLPIEQKAVEQLNEEASSAEPSSSISSHHDALTIRKAARDLATRTVEVQKTSFRQWGIMADWENPWRTMDKSFEVRQLEVFKEMVNKGLIYRQRKPVYWSPSSRTALAEAELEYREDHTSTAAFVKFRLGNSTEQSIVGIEPGVPVYVLIWTTTPWTLPANRAIAFRKDLKYVVVESQVHGRLLLAESRLGEVQKLFEHELKVVGRLEGADLVGSSYNDDVFEAGSCSRPLLHADFVSADSGTGLVHIAPGHGADDYELGLRHDISAFAPIDKGGYFTALASPKEPSMLEGKHVFSVGNKVILEELSKCGRLIAQHKYTHKYPYDWRSKQPVVLRATEQWFTNVGDFQNSALQALDSVKFVPEGGIFRLRSFIKNRSEWCISRQRAWGVPVPALYDEATGEAVLTDESVSHIISVISERGTDAWWSDDEHDLAWIPPSLRQSGTQKSFRRGKDTMDVWFDSGTSWTQTQASEHIADAYLEGSDQHRGWFQSSLLTYIACHDPGRQPQAPFKSLVTHGFTLDEHGRKMSKSIGNVVSPDEIIEGTLLPPLIRKVNGKKVELRDSMGVDALRLWIASCDYTKDITVNPVALKAINTTLAKYRVTLKQLLGILEDYDPTDSSLPKRLGNVHKIAIRQLENVEDAVRHCYQSMEYHKAVAEINRYINQDLSAFFFETIKDWAYCGTLQERRGVQIACDIVHLRLQQLLAPVVPLLVQETWQHTPQQIQTKHELSPFQRTWASANNASSSSSLSDTERQQLDHDTPILMQILAIIKILQEQARSAKQMGSSLQSFVTLQLEPGQDSPLLHRYKDDLEDLFVVSKVIICAGPTLPTHLATAQWSYQSQFTHAGLQMKVHVYAPQCAKCVRCWRYKAPVEAKKEEALCERCEGIIDELRVEKPEFFPDQLAAAAS